MRRHAKILLRLIGCGTALAVFGQSPSVPTVVEIADLRAGSVRAPDVRTWLEYDVTVQVNAPGSGRERYVDRVQVVFNLALEVPGDPEGFEFYRAAATAVALEAGRSSFRFYLPPEIVRRDRVRGMPRFYLIDVTVAGEPQRRVRNRVGPGFSSPEAMQRQGYEGAILGALRACKATRTPLSVGVIQCICAEYEPGGRGQGQGNGTRKELGELNSSADRYARDCAG